MAEPVLWLTQGAEFETWLTDVTKQQDAKQPHEEPAYTIEQLQTRFEVVSSVFSRLKDQKAPKPKKEDKPKNGKADAGASEGDAGAAGAGGEGGAGEEQADTGDNGADTGDAGGAEGAQDEAAAVLEDEAAQAGADEDVVPEEDVHDEL